MYWTWDVQLDYRSASLNIMMDDDDNSFMNKYASSNYATVVWKWTVRWYSSVSKFVWLVIFTIL